VHEETGAVEQPKEWVANIGYEMREVKIKHSKCEEKFHMLEALRVYF